MLKLANDSSFRRKPESRNARFWTPAFAGVTRIFLNNFEGDYRLGCTGKGLAWIA